MSDEQCWAAHPLVRPDPKPRTQISGRSARNRLVQERELVDVQVVDLGGLSGLDATPNADWQIRNVVFGVPGAGDVLRQVSFAGATFEDCTFDGLELADVGFESAQLIRCTFAQRGHPGTRLEACRFQGARLVGCDLRYCVVQRTSFRSASFDWCDLYRSTLGGGSSFEAAAIRRTSLYLADLSGCDIAPANLDGPLLQEDPAAFREFHRFGGMVGQGRQAELVAQGRAEAARVWASLGGLASSSGRSADEAACYVRRKGLERQLAWHELRTRGAGRGGSRFRRWLGLALADVTSGFGESPARVLRTVGWVVLATTMLLFLGHGLHQDGRPVASGWPTARAALFYALGNLVARAPQRLSVHGWWAEVLLIAETFVGIALAGLLGLVIANRVRSS